MVTTHNSVQRIYEEWDVPITVHQLGMKQIHIKCDELKMFIFTNSSAWKGCDIKSIF